MRSGPVSSALQNYEFELYVSGLTSKSIRTIAALREICERHLLNSYSLKIIDIYKDPHLAKRNDVFAVPTLIKRAPGRRQVFVGDLSNTKGLFRALGIRNEGDGHV